MEVKAKLRHYHVAPRKVRLVVDLIRALNTNKALAQLEYLNKGSAQAIAKLLNSAIANAVNNFSLDKDNLYIKEAFVDQGPVLKRWRARAHGRAAKIRKASSHITLILDEIKPSKKVVSKKLGKNKEKDSAKDKKEIKTKKVDLKDMKKEKNIGKLSGSGSSAQKPMHKKSKSFKSFIRKTGEK